MSAADTLALLPGGSGGVVRVSRSLIWVEGPDATGFLHGLLSHDIEGLDAGASRTALLLDAHGHVVASAVVHRDGPDAFTLVAEPHLAGVLAEALERYHFSEDLEILGPEPAEALVVTGARPVPGDGDIVLPGPLPDTHELILSEPGGRLPEGAPPERPAQALEAARILAGVPRVGVDTIATTLVQEAALEDVAVSFDKGCYLGQETVARAQYRGRVNRHLRGLRFAGAAPEPGAAVALDGRPVGTLTSVAPAPGGGSVGLAILRREAEPGATVAVGDDVATVTPLPFPAAPAVSDG